MSTDLQNIFTGLVLKYIHQHSLAIHLWDEIKSNYSHESRHYHNLHHISFMLHQLQMHRKKINDWDTLMFSVYYHDVIYDPLAIDNEEKSAELAQMRLQQISFPPEKIMKCCEQIMATKTHETTESDTAFLLDADLSILGKPWNEYESYSKAIRNEYILYPDNIYNPGRKNVLLRFLQMKSIFKTEEFQIKYESAARDNIKREIEILENDQT